MIFPFIIKKVNKKVILYKITHDARHRAYTNNLPNYLLVASKKAAVILLYF